MSLFKQFKHAWDALDYADAGEFLSYAAKCRVIGVEPPPDYHGYLPPLETVSRRAIAINLGRNLSISTMDYAIGAAKRLEASLILLRSPGKSTPEAVITTLQARIKAEGVCWREESLASPWIESITTFLRHHAEVVCLVLGPSDLNPHILTTPSKNGHRWTFSAPVVVVQGDTPLPQPA